jgi:hypothetical protein
MPLLNPTSSLRPLPRSWGARYGPNPSGPSNATRSHWPRPSNGSNTTQTPARTDPRPDNRRMLKPTEPAGLLLAQAVCVPISGAFPRAARQAPSDERPTSGTRESRTRRTTRHRGTRHTRPPRRSPQRCWQVWGRPAAATGQMTPSPEPDLSQRPCSAAGPGATRESQPR